MKNKILLILLLLLTVCFCMSFLWKNNELQKQKVEVISKNIIGTQKISKVEKIKSDYDIAIENMQKDMNEIEAIADEKEWFIAYKEIIDKNSKTIDPPETIYDYFTEEDLYLLFKVVQAEIGDEYSFKQKVNVANVIFNRLDHDKFPDDLTYLLIPDQFQVIEDGRYKEVKVSENTILACEYAFLFPDTTNGSLFFDSNNTLDYEFVFEDGAHNFYKIEGEENNE